VRLAGEGNQSVGSARRRGEVPEPLGEEAHEVRELRRLDAQLGQPVQHLRHEHGPALAHLLIGRGEVRACALHQRGHARAAAVHVQNHSVQVPRVRLVVCRGVDVPVDRRAERRKSQDIFHGEFDLTSAPRIQNDGLIIRLPRRLRGSY
jgi:hypothetical protein